RFRDAVDGRQDHRYVQTRYRTLSNHFGSFDRRYHQSRFGPRYRHINRSYISITTIYRGLDSGYSRYSSSWGRGYREPERVIIYESAPSRHYRPFGLAIDRHKRHDNRRYKSSRSNKHRSDRGRRNHYK